MTFWGLPVLRIFFYLLVHGVICEVHMAADDEQVLRPGIDGAIGVKSHEGVELGELQRVLIERVIDVGSRGPYLFHLA